MERKPELNQGTGSESRRALLAGAFLISACLFFILTLTELLSRNTGLSVVGATAAVICAGTGIYTWMIGENHGLMRLALACGLSVPASVLALHASGLPLVFSLLAPFALVYLLGPVEAFLWIVMGTGATFVLHTYLSPGMPTAFELGVTELALLLTGAFAIAAGYERMGRRLLAHGASERERLEAEILTKNVMAERNETLLRDLNNALREVRELNGLIPMCASCKKIRGDEDFWEHVEAYLHKRTRLQFSHGLCPECVDSAMEDLEQHDCGREVAR